jgi:hypothetical protein
MIIEKNTIGISPKKNLCCSFSIYTQSLAGVLFRVVTTLVNLYKFHIYMQSGEKEQDKSQLPPLNQMSSGREMKRLIYSNCAF